MQNPKVTIIVPTYDRAQLLMDRCLKSISMQTFQDFEVIIMIDAGPKFDLFVPDSTKYVSYRNEVNKGKSWCVNEAVKKARGEYILVVDDDNEILPTFLQETIGCLEEATSAAQTRDNGKFDACFSGRIVRHSGFDDYAPASWIHGYGFTAIDWGWLIKKYVFDTCQYDEALSGDEDADFGIQFFKHFKAVPLDKPLCIAYAEGGSGISFANEKRLDSLRRFYAKDWRAYEKAGPKDLSFVNRFVGRNLYQAGFKAEAITYFKKAFLCYKNTRTLLHWLVSHISYKAYYKLMRLEERYYSYKRRKNYGIK